MYRSRSGGRPRDDDPDEAPETPPDEPAPAPIQDPPAEPKPTPYVVRRRVQTLPSPGSAA